MLSRASSTRLRHYNALLARRGQTSRAVAVVVPNGPGPLPEPISKARRVIPSGGPQHRIPKVKGKRSGVVIAAEHPAIIKAHTLFPSTVVDVADSPRLLVDGFNSRKIGKRFTRGPWRGMPIYTLTLEERATCPTTCSEWRTCYGNNTHYARRHRHGPELETRLAAELDALALRHPGGYVVRPHILGDFYSTDYVKVWADALERLPSLRIFGFTARAMSDPIGAAVLDMNARFRKRCRIRFSGTDAGGLGALVIKRREDSRHVICPAQTNQTDCCATCGLCPSMLRPVEFLRH